MSFDKAQDRHVILAYMDESGEAHYGKKMDQRPHFLRSCVIVRENQLADVEAAVRKVCEGFPDCQKTWTKCRFHAKDVYWGTGDWEEYKDCNEVRIGALIEMFYVLKNHGLYVTFGHVHKPKVFRQYAFPLEPAPLTFVQCGHIVERWMARFAPDQRWLPIVGTSQHDRDVKEVFSTCRITGSPIKRSRIKWKRVCDVMSITSPEDSDIFLLSDLCAFICSRKMQGKADWEGQLYELFEGQLYDPWTFKPGW
jgi:hypothetical protein